MGRTTSHSPLPFVALLAAMLVSLLMATHVHGQTTQPAESDTFAKAPTTAPARNSAWAETVNALANALVDDNVAPGASVADDDAAFADLITGDAIIRPFNRASREEIATLHARTAGMTILTSRSYRQTPTEMASEIASDLKDLPISEAVKRRLTPVDAADSKRANTTAARWISSALFVTGNEPVGVIVLWREDPRSRDAEESSNMPVFILVKGEYVDGRYRVSQLAYGDPVPPAPAPSASAN